MYVVLRKGAESKKGLILKGDTYISNPKYKKYLIVFKTESWKEAEAILRKIKVGEKLDAPQDLPAEPVNIEWKVKNEGIAFVYGLYDHLDKLLYIGVTSSPTYRLQSHSQSKKNFRSMKVLFNFNSRDTANSYERFAIATLLPPLNILVEGIAPGSKHDSKSLEKFGELSDTKSLPKITTYKQKNTKQKPSIKKKKKPKQNHSATVFCTKCGFAAGKNNRYATTEGTFHLKPCLSPEEKEELNNRNEKIKTDSIERKLHSEPSLRCKYCKKGLGSGRHMDCRKKRLKELGRI